MNRSVVTSGLVVAVLAVAGVAAWYGCLRDDAPPPVSVEDPAAAAAGAMPASGAESASRGGGR